LVDDLGIRNNRAYQLHRGKPLIAIWGLGFNDHRRYTLAECEALIDFLKTDPTYGGNAVMLGVPSGWREQVWDTLGKTEAPEFQSILQKADVISPWTPGRYADLGSVRLHAERFWKPDYQWCIAHGIDYMPVVFPGFSWKNLKGVSTNISRNDGRFLWEQYRQLTDLGVNMIYQAMFDEIDEGTQIFKVSNSPPTDASFETYRPLPNDFYLWLVGTAAKYLREGRNLPERIVTPKLWPEVTSYLRAHDDAAYGEAQASYESQIGLLKIADTMADPTKSRSNSFSFNDAKFSVSGVWQPGHLRSDDPSGSMTWNYDVPKTRAYAISIRYPLDPALAHQTDARLRITQGETVVANLRLNLREHGLQWFDVGVFPLRAGTPCEIMLSKGESEGVITIFEVRLRDPSQ